MTDKIAIVEDKIYDVIDEDPSLTEIQSLLDLLNIALLDARVKLGRLLKEEK